MKKENEKVKQRNKHYLSRKIVIALSLSAIMLFLLPLLANHAEAKRANVSVTYDAGSGGHVGSSNGDRTKVITYDTNEIYRAQLPKAYRGGYEFVGWYYNGTEIKTVAAAAGKKLTAKWKQLPTYTVTYKNLSGANYAPSTQKKLTDVPLTLTNVTPTKTGYTFKGYDTSSAAKNIVWRPGQQYKANKDLTLYAVWAPLEYNVTYNLEGGKLSNGSTTISMSKKIYGTTLYLTKETPIKDGYEFQGWKEDNSTVIYSSGGAFTENRGAVLHAVWKIKTYTIQYDLKGGSCENGSSTVANQTKTYNIDCTLAKGPFYKTGYDFMGWDTSSTAKKVVYKGGQVYSSNASVKLYAVWNAKVYYVTYNLEDGKLSDGSTSIMKQAKTHGVAITLSKEIPVKSGYEFVGWAVGNNTVALYNPGDSYTKNEPCSLHAIWVPTYQIGFDGYGAPSGMTVAKGKVITLPNPTTSLDGHTFKGWSTSYSSNEVAYSAGANYTVTGNITFKAVWEHNADNRNYTPVMIEDPTCTKYGTRAWVCYLCGDCFYEPIPQLSHQIVTTEVKPSGTSCLHQVINTCSVCGMSTIISSTFEHNWEVVESDHCCGMTGHVKYYCNRCNTYRESDEIIDHYYCVIEQGNSITVECSYCGQEKNSVTPEEFYTYLHTGQPLSSQSDEYQIDFIDKYLKFVSPNNYDPLMSEYIKGGGIYAELPGKDFQRTLTALGRAETFSSRIADALKKRAENSGCKELIEQFTEESKYLKALGTAFKYSGKGYATIKLLVACDSGSWEDVYDAATGLVGKFIPFGTKIARAPVNIANSIAKLGKIRENQIKGAELADAINKYIILLPQNDPRHNDHEIGELLLQDGKIDEAVKYYHLANFDSDIIQKIVEAYAHLEVSDLDSVDDATIKHFSEDALFVLSFYRAVLMNEMNQVELKKYDSDRGVFVKHPDDWENTVGLILKLLK